MNLPALNFPQYRFRFITKEGKTYIFDNIRKKYVFLSPEEWVRQNTIRYLTETLKYPSALMAVEYPFHVNRMKKRADIVVFKPAGKPWLLVECKAPQVAVTRRTLEQALRYNMELNTPYFMLTNGLNHYFCRLNYENRTFTFVENLPAYRDENPSGT